MGALGQFKRDLIREGQREGSALAKLRPGTYTGRKRSLTPAQAVEMCKRIDKGESRTRFAREMNIRRQTLTGMLPQPGRGREGHSAVYALPVWAGGNPCAWFVRYLLHAKTAG